MSKYFPPIYNKSSFHCPHCNVYANQSWCDVYYTHANFTRYYYLEASICGHCGEKSLWLKEQMIYPEKTTAPPPHDDIPIELSDDYMEASSIINKSPRGTAAILRLAIQKLMVVLGESGKDINKDIGSLVQKGLHPDVQKALDIVRVIGNESVLKQLFSYSISSIL